MPEKNRDRIREFLASPPFAVVGASNDIHKYGAKVFAAYRSKGLRAFPVNPREKRIQGEPAFASLKDLPEPVESISIITPPAVTERIVDEAIAAGVRRIWMQPGAESDAAIENAAAHGIDVIAGGPCLLVAIGYRE